MWRMMTPAKGDYTSAPLNAEGRRVTDAWDPAKDEAEGNQCKAYGAGGIMRMPERLHIFWVDDNTLEMDIDAGHAEAALPFRRIEVAWRRAAAARRFRGDLGESSCSGEREPLLTAPRREGRQPARGNHAHEARISREERSALQRKCGAERTLYGDRFARRRYLFDPDFGDRRPYISPGAFSAEQPVQAGARRFQVGSHALPALVAYVASRQAGAGRTGTCSRRAVGSPAEINPRDREIGVLGELRRFLTRETPSFSCDDLKPSRWKRRSLAALRTTIFRFADQFVEVKSGLVKPLRRKTRRGHAPR